MKFPTSLTKARSITLHGIDGRIGFFALKGGERFSFENPVGRYPWEFIAQRDRQRVKEFFAAVASGIIKGNCRYAIDSGSIGMPDEWICDTYWHPTPCSDFPVLGTSETWNAVVESLSPRERQVAKLLPIYSLKEISHLLRLNVSTVETLRHRIGEKVDLLGPALVAWCQSHGDVL